MDYIKMLVFAMVVALLILLIKTIRNWTRKSGALVKAVKISETAQELRNETPCSVCGMTRLLLPHIAEDFPEFSYSEFKAREEALLLSYFAAITQQCPDRLSEYSQTLLEQVRQEISHQQADGMTRAYSNVQIHQTELSDYRKQDGECRVVFQSAVGYALRIGDGEEEQRQARYNVELLYVQDANQAQLHQTDAAFSMTCPNCGAPIRSLGRKACEFCGTVVQEVNRYAWSFDRIYEFDK